MSDPLVSTYEFDVRGYDCGYGGPLRIFAMANFLQDAAGYNAAKHGFGMDDLHAAGLTWMLSRLELRVDKLPREGSRVEVRTWPAGTRKLFAMRALDMRSPDGSSLVRALYAYLVVDMGSRRPLRPEGLFEKGIPSASEPLPVPGYSFAIPAPVDPKPDFAQRVRGRHMDHNGHANNAHLMNWLVDAASPRGRAEAEGSGAEGSVVEGSLSALRVQFDSEALEGDELLASSGTAEGDPFGGGFAAVSVVSELRRGEAMVARALAGWR